jgi:beta-lactamase superfamily II metal-dependent hydrolase
MDGKLLVRMFNVGLGDCIYLRVPDLQRNVHILIDCGNKFGSLNRLGQCVASLKGELPESDGGKKRLDLLVVSHPHEDHQKGFEAEFFDSIQIDHIWLSPVFNRENPQAKGFFALKDAAGRALNAYEDLPADALAGMRIEIQELLSLSKSEALEMLNQTLPERNGIQPLYASADTPAEQLKLFDDPAVSFKVLGPMADIDSFYMGGNGLMTTTSDASPSALADGYQAVYNDPAAVEVRMPSNISAQDFKTLRGSIHADALAAAAVAGHVENNLSVVLLLEWHGRRLLFTGDAEWNAARQGAVTPGRSNGSWNVMWQLRQADLSLPLDFYKVGHHGSENATPWKPPDPQTGEEHPINQILYKLLPGAEAGGPPRTYAVVSTLRTKRWPSIPDAALLGELGKRVANARTAYVEKKGPSSVKPQVPQPARTDLEQQLTQTPNKAVDHIDVEFTPL